MEREAYWKCRRELDEAREVLDTASTTSSRAVAAAACRRALRVCFLLDRELNGTSYPADFAAGPAMESFRIRHPRLFEHESILHPTTMLSALEREDNEASPGGVGEADAEADFERLFLPAARSIRLMLDEVTLDLRRPGRWSWRVYAALLALSAAGVALRWAWMMGTSEGLTVTYFRGMNFEKPVARRVAQQVLAEYGEKRPALPAPRNRFSARWEGTLVAPVATNYSFYCQSEGGMRVSIDGDLVLNNWRELTWQASGTHGNKVLSAGDHALVVEYFKSTGRGALRLRWAGGPIPDNSVVGAPYLKR
jgi:hypothetical protein